MKYAGILENDFVNGENVCVSFWVQGCDMCPHCDGCHNPQTWDFDGGLEATEDALVNQVISAISRNGIQRNFSVLGGEPMALKNVEFVNKLILAVKEKYPDIKVFIWSGYEIEALQARDDLATKSILDNIYMIACGPFKKDLRDVTLKYVGSSNQRVLYKGKDF